MGKATPLLDDGRHGIAFLPYARLAARHRVAGVDFLPLRTRAGRLSSALKSAHLPLRKVLSGYTARDGKRFDNCVVATISGRGWDLNETDNDAVNWATSLLFLAAWSRNQYFQSFGGGYVNSSMFRVVGQRFSGSVPNWITITAKRRDGRTMDGGYRHGEVKFQLPVQVSVRDLAEIDVPLLTALDAAHANNTMVAQRLRTALPFVELANSDDDFMTAHAEAILMGSAFEQLLDGDGAYKLSQKFDACLVVSEA